MEEQMGKPEKQHMGRQMKRLRKKQPEITVIMGVYNPEDEQRLRRAVASIVRQSFRDWEMILYDDGSREECAALIRRAARMDRRIRYIRGGKNRGLAAALNACIRRARGRYLARMDADDLCRGDRLARQYAFLEKHPHFQWVGSCAQLTDDEGVWGFQPVPAVPGKEDFLYNSPYIHPTVMFRRRVLLESGGYDTSRRYRQCEDYELFLRLHSRGYRGANLQEPLLRYREDCLSHRRRTLGRRWREAMLRWRGFRSLGILRAETLAYVGKPLLAGLVPGPLHHQIRKWVKRDHGRKRKNL